MALQRHTVGALQLTAEYPLGIADRIISKVRFSRLTQVVHSSKLAGNGNEIPMEDHSEKYVRRDCQLCL